MSADLKRIRKMENYLNECTEATKELVSQLDRMNKVRKHMIALFDYYGSDEWFDDREAELPEGTAAGILSEDAVYDAITDVRDAAFLMLEQATDILKNRI